MMPPKKTDDDVTIIGTKADIERLQKTFASLVMLQGNEIGKQFNIRRNDLIIGRTSSADIIIKDKRISRSHARINVLYLHENKKNQYVLSDLDSTNHVYVNGKQIQNHVLEDGDKIQIGATILKFEIQDAVDAKFHADMQHKIEYDDLTSLLTYESFKLALGWELEIKGKRKNFSLLIMDIDDFKQINDSYGHLTGSFILKEIGSIIKNNTRQFDMTARYGGEEFIACLHDTDKHTGLLTAERLRQAIADHAYNYNNRAVKVTISIGISQFPHNGQTLDELVHAADDMLYKAKREGKNRVCAAD